jgi:hypothetical protein
VLAGPDRAAGSEGQFSAHNSFCQTKLVWLRLWRGHEFDRVKDAASISKHGVPLAPAAHLKVKAILPR